ncbi:putative baseplate protein [Achromobacter phage vB_AxyP_19-32_Axy23]|uniref:Putative baseplate protein n=1 Tax=Achromobacter phage vB_AxyP_19-32_Axy23 TaxID=2591047 RepID=A0A514CW25_9CAUD|nr:putative baseplate protein [Achromobacter phage vB_AxyP_19-32_Axy23]
MAVTRDSQPLRPAGVSSAQIAQSQVQNARPDVAAHLNATGRTSDPMSAQSSATATTASSQADNTVLRTILGYTEKLAWKGLDISRQEAYARGQQAAMQGLSEDRLGNDPTTRDWEVAGKRDMAAKMALASRQAQFAAELKQNREKSPAEFAKLMEFSRKALWDQMQGMSREARASLTQQLMASDASLQATHSKEHAKFIIEQKQAGIAAITQTMVNDLDMSKDDAIAYTANIGKFTSFMHGVVTSTDMPTDVKQKLLTEMTGFALDGNHQLLYRELRDTEVPLPDGRTGSMLSLLPIKEQAALGEKFRKAKNETQLFEHGDYFNNLAKLEADLSNPLADKPDPQDVNNILMQGASRGIISASKYESVMKAVYLANGKEMNKSAIADAYMRGDSQKLNNLGATQTEGLDALRETMQRKAVPLGKQVETFHAAGMAGSAGAFTEIGKLMQPAFNEVMASKDGGVTEASASMFKQFFAQMDAAERGGQQGAFHLAMAGLSDEQQTIAAYMRNAVKTEGRSVEDASRLAAERVARDVAMPPDARKRLALSPERTKEDAAMVAEIGEMGLLSTAWSGLKFWSADEANRRAITPFRVGGTGNERLNDGAVAQAKLAMQEELAWIGEQNPLLPADARKSKALAAVANRTIPTEDGPFILPKGATVQSVFGVDAPKDRVGVVLDELTKGLKGDAAHIGYRIDSGGKLRYERLNGDGQLMSAATLEPSTVSGMLEVQRNREAARVNRLIGEGTTVQQSGGSVTFNGANTAAVDPTVMHQLRSNLVNHEGVRSDPYDDLSGRGIRTGGVGVSSTNTYFPASARNRTWTQQEINSTFAMASNEAAMAGTKVQQQLGVTSNDAFLLFAELAYQSGPGFASTPAYKPLMQAIASGDQAAAAEAIKSTPAYKWTGEKSARREFYERSINNIFKR